MTTSTGLTSAPSRRAFLRSCAGHLASAGAFAPITRRLAWAQQPAEGVIATAPFGYLQRVANGVWALVSTPLQGSRTTLCNGGLVAGKSGVVAIEGFFDPAGAAWLAARSKELTGRLPSQIVVTHYHADHSNGVAGYVGEGEAPALRATAVTRDLALEKNQPADPARTSALSRVVPLPADQPFTIELGDRQIRAEPRRGHTASDVSLEVVDAGVVFCGDLVWNAMFPNYVDAMPSELARSARALRTSGDSKTFVPGHGAVAKAADLDHYLDMLDEVAEGARSAHAKGLTAAEGARTFALSKPLGEWTLLNPAFFERAFAAWYRELK